MHVGASLKLSWTDVIFFVGCGVASVTFRCYSFIVRLLLLLI